jgi:predicted MFS family arabinose efflux permease
LALVSEAAGWRAAFIGLALIQALAGLLFWVLVRDDPPGQPPKVRHPETLTTMLAGFWTVLRLPGLVRVMALQLVGYAVQVTVIGLWAGPYLHDVHGLDATARGNVVVAMAIAQLAGVLAYGPLDRILDSRKRVAAAGAFLTILPLATLAAYDQPPTALAIALLITTSAVSSYGIVVVTHGRSFYPEPLAGRGTTTFNTVQAIGCVLMPMLTALIPALYPITPRGWAPEAYRMIFGAIATALVLGLAVYMTSRDARPSSL